MLKGDIDLLYDIKYWWRQQGMQSRRRRVCTSVVVVGLWVEDYNFCSSVTGRRHLISSEWSPYLCLPSRLHVSPIRDSISVPRLKHPPTSTPQTHYFARPEITRQKVRHFVQASICYFSVMHLKKKVVCKPQPFCSGRNVLIHWGLNKIKDGRRICNVFWQIRAGSKWPTQQKTYSSASLN